MLIQQLEIPLLFTSVDDFSMPYSTHQGRYVDNLDFTQKSTQIPQKLNIAPKLLLTIHLAVPSNKKSCKFMNYYHRRKHALDIYNE